MSILRLMFSRRWILTTLLVIAGASVCARLGIWQLDRLEQRREFNAHYLTIRNEPALNLNGLLPPNLSSNEYRDAAAQGFYDFTNQVALRNQYHGNVYGYHLLTPLVLEDGLAVMVDRGWIPADGNSAPPDWRRYDESNPVNVTGILRLGQVKAEIGGLTDPDLVQGQDRLDVWNMVNLDRIAAQLPYRLLPIYIQLSPDPGDVTPPIPYQPEIEISEGPHLGYAGQWFVFASILFFGYPLFYLRKQRSGS